MIGHTLDRWQFVKNAFHAVQSLTPVARDTLLASLCGNDQTLHSELTHLLAAHDHVGASFLESPLVQSLVSWSGADEESPRPVTESASPVGGRISHYAIEAEIGAGGMGTVYRAWDIALGRPAAVKVLSTTFTPLLCDRLRREAEACARLQHPSIATFFESGDAEDGVFIAMELVDGETLRSRLRRGPVPTAEAVAICCSVLEALSHAHSVGILHRDIKPENVMVTGQRSAKLLDFGLARDCSTDGATVGMTDILPPSTIVGTVGYMSPEQIMGGALDVRSDLFQVGAVLYEALTGHPAFPGSTAIERLSAVLAREPDAIDAAVPSAIAAITRRALSRGAAERYPSASAFLIELQDAVAGESLGRDLFLQLDKGSMDRARCSYEQAVTATPNYATALSDLARVYAMRFTFTTDRATLEVAANLARRAIAADSTLAGGYNWLGYAQWRLGEPGAAAATLQQARARRPTWFSPWYFGAAVAVVNGQPDEALRLAQRAVTLEANQDVTTHDPSGGAGAAAARSHAPMWCVACLHTDGGRYQEALRCFERCAVSDADDRRRTHWAGLGGYHAECLRRAGRLDEARHVCVAAISEVEKSDHMYRDSHRGLCLVTLGRIALQQHDDAAASAAFRQALAHLHGRNRTLAGGFLAVQAHAGLAQTERDVREFDKALEIFTLRRRFDFSWLFFCADDATLLGLARAAHAVERRNEAENLRARAEAAGSFEARGPAPLQ